PLGCLREGTASEEASDWQSRDAQHRAAKLDVSHPGQALAAADDLFFKERSDARCSDEIAHSPLESSASSNLKHDYKIFVDGNLIADGGAIGPADVKAVADDLGSLKLKFSSQSDSDHLALPAALNPVSNIRHIEIRDAQNRVVL